MSNAFHTFTFTTPDDAVAAVRARLSAVGAETVDLRDACGRVLAAMVSADRDSPACDVSSMDGYAVRLAGLRPGALAVAAESRIGHAPPDMPADGVVKIATGAPVPPGTDAVVPREQTDESTPGAVTLRIDPASVAAGQNVRRRGDNLRGGQVVVEAETLITLGVVAALANFGVAGVAVRRRVRVGVLTTGDELLDVGAAPQPWQIRDANGPAVSALLAATPWVEAVAPERCADSPDALRRAVAGLLDACDAVVLTGGVSMGDRDYVPQVVRDVGAEVVFHKLPVRPGKPVLAAVTPGGKLVVGLPGNPVSALVGATRLVGPMLRRLAGVDAAAAVSRVTLADPDDATLRLWWWRLVRFDADGGAALVGSRSSGDLVSAARSDGFVELPPGERGAGPWRAYRWEL